MSTISSSGLSFSGLASGMDTDAMVKAMISGYETKYNNEQKEQLMLDLKLEKYREVNTKVVDFYDDYLRKMRLESTFNSSTTSSSNPDAVEVTGGGKTGDQITITQLAKPINVTTNKVNSDIKSGDTKLSELGFSVLDGIKFTDKDGNETIIGLRELDGKGMIESNKNGVISVETVDDLIDAFADKDISIGFDEETGKFDLTSFNDHNGNASYTISAVKMQEKEPQDPTLDSTQYEYVDIEDNTGTTHVDEAEEATNELLGKLGLAGKTTWEVDERSLAKHAKISKDLHGHTLEINGNSINIDSTTTMDDIKNMLGLEVDEEGYFDVTKMSGIKVTDSATGAEVQNNDIEIALSDLGIEDGYVVQSSRYESVQVGLKEIDGKTTLGDLGVSGSIEIEIDGNSHVIKLDEKKTLEELTEELNKTGLKVEFHDGQDSFSITTDAKSLKIKETETGSLAKLGIQPPTEGKEPVTEDTALTELGFKIGDVITVEDKYQGTRRIEIVDPSSGGGSTGYQTAATMDDLAGTGFFSFDEKTQTIKLNREDTMTDIKVQSKSQFDKEMDPTRPPKTDAEIEAEHEYTVESLKNLGISKSIVYEDGIPRFEYETSVVGEGDYEYEAQLAKGTYNGMEVESDTNVFKLDGITFVAKKITDDPETKEVEEVVTIDKTIDEEALFETITGFVDAYNTLVDELSAYTDAPYDPKKDSGYTPLLPDEKEGMSDADIELWDEKVDSLLLRDDPNIERLLDSLRYDLMEVYPGNESFKSLGEIGITSSIDYTQQGKLEIDEEKLRAAITKDAEGIKTLFVGDSEKGVDGYAEKMYDGVTELLKSSNTSSSMFLFNDLELEKAITDQQEEIDKAYDNMIAKEEIYQAQFLAMEMAIQEMNSQMNLFNQSAM